MRQMRLFAAVAVALLLVSLVVIPSYSVSNQEERKQFYVGITYGGSSVQEAKDLIDKVKGCTNLFILQSGSLQGNIASMEEIGDYAIASKMNYAVYGSNRVSAGLNDQALSNWLVKAKERWGDHFIGVYYNDEIGGNMLDKSFSLETTEVQTESGSSAYTGITKEAGGGISMMAINQFYKYWPNGTIDVQTSEGLVQYYPDGTITATRHVFENDTVQLVFYTSENITQFPLPIQPYKEVLKQNPVQTQDDAAKLFVNSTKNGLEAIDKKQLEHKAITVFTADYGLYWWDYKGNVIRLKIYVIAESI
jgi:hypothetical protein